MFGRVSRSIRYVVQDFRLGDFPGGRDGYGTVKSHYVVKFNEVPLIGLLRSSDIADSINQSMSDLNGTSMPVIKLTFVAAAEPKN